MRSASSISAGSSSVTKYIASPARIASRVFGWPSTTRSPSAMPSIVRSPPVASSITSSSGPPSPAAARPLPRAASPPSPGRSCSSWCARSTVGSRTRKPRDPDENTGLKQTGRSGIAELARGRRDLAARRSTRRNSGAGTPIRWSSAYVSALSFERRIVSGPETSTGTGKRRVRGEPCEVERRLRQHGVDALALDDLEHRVREAGIGARRDEMERVAEVPPDRALRHVRADEAHLALAVLAQRAQQRRGAGRAGGGDEHRDRRLMPRSIRSSASCSRRRSRFGVQHRPHRLAHRRALVDPDLRVRRAAAARERARARAPRAGSRGASAGSSRSGTCSGSKYARLHHVHRAGDRRRHVLGIGVVPGDDRVEALVELGVRIDGVQPDRVAELAQPRRSRRAPRRGEVVEDGLGHQEVRRARAALGLDARPSRAPRRARGRRRGAGRDRRRRAPGRRARTGSRRSAPPRAARGSGSRSKAQLIAAPVSTGTWPRPSGSMNRDELVAHDLEARLAYEPRVRLRREAREVGRRAEPLARPSRGVARPEACQDQAAAARASRGCGRNRPASSSRGTWLNDVERAHGVDRRRLELELGEVGVEDVRLGTRRPARRSCSAERSTPVTSEALGEHPRLAGAAAAAELERHARPVRDVRDELVAPLAPRVVRRSALSTTRRRVVHRVVARARRSRSAGRSLHLHLEQPRRRLGALRAPRRSCRRRRSRSRGGRRRAAPGRIVSPTCRYVSAWTTPSAASTGSSEPIATTRARRQRAGLTR